MAVVNNPALGNTICSECAQPATVHQQRTGKGRFLYTRGCDCKYRVSPGAVFQTRLWNETEWQAGAQPIQPPNAKSNEGRMSDFDPNEPPAPVPIQPEAVIDPGQPEPPPVVEPETPPAATGGATMRNWFAGLLLIAGAALVALTGRKP